MRRRVVWVLLLGFFFVEPARPQEFQRVNANIGIGMAFPLSDASKISNLSGHFILGAGANINRRFGMNSEFLWLKLPIKQSALNQAGVLDANSAEVALTVNGIARFPLNGHIGIYAIGGGGFYHRWASLLLDQTGLIPAVVCGPFFTFWGVNCVGVSLPSNQVPGEVSSSAFGGNVGGGVTIPLGERTMKLYTETRYHYVPHNNVNSNNLLLTFGVRW